MRELFLIAIALMLTIYTYGQVSISELEAAASYANAEHNSKYVVNNSIASKTPILNRLPTAIKAVQYKAVTPCPLRIMEVPKTVYWSDRLEQQIATSRNSIKNSTVVTNPQEPTKIGLLNLFKNTDPTFVTFDKPTYHLPFAIQQVNRTIYLGDRIEAHYIALEKKEALANQDIDSENKVVDKIEEEVVAVNSTTSAATSRGAIISKRELKAIVRRARGKNDDYTEATYKSGTKKIAVTSNSKTTKDKLVKTIIPANNHKEDHVEHINSSNSVKPKYETEVVNRELAVLDKMIISNTTNTSAATVSASNIHTSMKSEPMEVTSEIINGESVITEIKPVAQPKENRTIKAEPFSMHTIDNELISMNQLNGKVVVLNFWFTSCVECIREIPHLNDLKDRYGNQEIEFLGICLNDKPKINAFLEDHPFNWKQIPNARQVAHDFYMFAYPGHAVVDKDGGIITLLNGNEPDVLQQLETAIQVGLGEAF